MKKPGVTKEDRIAKYLEAIPAAVAGTGGHKQTFKVACALYNGWALSEKETLVWLKIYNARCEPPWSDKELEHKAQNAAHANHDKPRGYLLGESRSTFEKAPPDWTLPTKPIGVWNVPTTLTTPNSISMCTTVNSTATRVEIENTVVNVVKPGISLLEGSEIGVNGPKTETLDREEVSILDPEAQRIAGVSEEQLSEEQLAEASRIGHELTKLYQGGAISGPDDPDALFYATLLRTFGGTITASTTPAHDAPAGLTPEQLVPEPQAGLSARERMAFYDADLADAIGAEYIISDHDYQPPVFSARSSSRKRNLTTEAESPPDAKLGHVSELQRRPIPS